MTVMKDKGPEMLAIFCTLTGIATILVALRFWVRMKYLRKLGADDWVVLISLVRCGARYLCRNSQTED